MNTQTDNAAAGTQVHSLVKHHQQHGSNSGNSTSSSSNSSNNSNSISNNSSNPVLGSNNDRNTKESSQVAAASSSSSTIAQMEVASSTSSACIPASTPLLLHQFTHHPPQHLLQHQHQHCRNVIHQDEDDNTSSTNLHVSPSLSQESSSSPDKAATISNHTEDMPDLHCKYLTRTTHSSVDTECLPRDHSGIDSRSVDASSSLSFPLYFAAADPSRSPTTLISTSISEHRPSQIARTESSSSSSSSSSSQHTICDARNPRSSAACFVGLDTCDDGQEKQDIATPPSSESIDLNTPPSSLMTTVSGISSQYSNAIKDEAIYSSQGLSSVDHCKGIAQHKASDATDGICGLQDDTHLIQTSTPLSPAFSSYYLSTSSELLAHGNQMEKSDEQAHPTTQPFTPSSNQQGPRFVSPNALLHRRLIGKSQKSPLKRSRISPSKSVLAQSFVGSSTDALNFQEQRRSSLGNEASTSAQKPPKEGSAQPTSSITSFQLQPVPASKRRKITGNSPNKKSAPVAVSPLVEKRRKRNPEARAHFASPQQQRRGILTSTTTKPSNLHTPFKVFDSRLSGLEKSTISKGKAPAAPQFVAAINTPSQPRTRISRPRLNRTQSLPNLKAKPVLDMNLTACHRLALPPRLAEYLASLRDSAQRQHHHIQQIPLDGAVSTPLSTRDRLAGSAMAAQASSFSRNGYCSTMIDSLGNVKSTFIPSLHPPITRQTLKELDLHEILKNPQLRHDIVFDSNVQFRPNFDGERGRKKKELGNKYWYAIQKEIETGCTCTHFSGKLLLPCACGSDNGKTAISRFASSLSSVKSPMPLLGNYAHSGSGFNGLLASRSDDTAAPPGTPAPGSAKVKSPNCAIGLGNGRIPSRIPLLIQELRSICLSVLPCPPSGNDRNTTPASAKLTLSSPTTNKDRSPQRQAVPATASPYSNRSTAATPNTATSSVATHHILIAQALDSHLITQQIRHGILDIASLMSFLGSILKLHCAPMRDEVIEKMIKTVCVDGEVAMGLRMCFEILELMKLDIANHQLRSSRMYLIETAVDFEIRWFREQLDQRRISLEKTRQWFTNSFNEQKKLDTLNILNRTKVISKSFDEGLMQLILEPPLTSAAASTAVPLTNSTSSLKQAYSNNYPETFQFDAYRLMSFHGDVTDITIVYMLLLLFRQLACSSTNLSQEPLPSTTWSASAISENASTIATRQLASVKSEIWTLLNDADQETSLVGTCQPSAPRTPTTPGLAGRILSHGVLSGSHKLENPTWRKAMSDVLLQIAARAIDVQIQARRESRQQQQQQAPNTSSRPTPPPREETMKMLMSWMETNLRRGSPLHQLCQQRLKNVLSAHLEESQPKDRVAKTSRKDREEADEAQGSASKRVRLLDGSIAFHREVSSGKESLESDTPSKSNVEVAIQKGGLEPFTAEIKLLLDRIIKVRTFHLRVFRCLYEKIASEIHQDV